MTNRVLTEHWIQEKNKALELANERLQELSIRDGLTKLYNRLQLDRQYPDQWNFSVRNHLSVTVFMVDVDYFKPFNDNYGHRAGDEALRNIADSLARGFRRASDFVARYGGEEFVVVSSGRTEEEATADAERICSDIRALNIKHEYSYVADIVTVSVGYVTCAPNASDDPEALLVAADRALYDAKDQGRDRAVSVQWQSSI